MAEPTVVKFYTQVSYINYDNSNITHKRGVVMVMTVSNFAVCRDVARRAVSSATAELLIQNDHDIFPD